MGTRPHRSRAKRERGAEGGGAGAGVCGVCGVSACCFCCGHTLSAGPRQEQGRLPTGTTTKVQSSDRNGARSSKHHPSFLLPHQHQAYPRD